MKYYPVSVEENMHELSIAQNIVKIVHQEYVKGDFHDKVKKVWFSAGKMNAIIPASLQLNFNVVKKNYEELKTTELIIEEKEVVIQCRQCKKEVELEEPLFRCQRCDSADINLVQGKEMFVESFEV